jgi:Mg2+ and Co2+ transporter CorA
MKVYSFESGVVKVLPTEQVAKNLAPKAFVWLSLNPQEFALQLPLVQEWAQQLGGSALLDLHCQDLASVTHPSDYDFTSVYDLIIFRKLLTQVHNQTLLKNQPQIIFKLLDTCALGFVLFDRLLISVHPTDDDTAQVAATRFIAQSKPPDPIQNIANDSHSLGRWRPPSSAADLMLRMINSVVDRYLDVRKDLTKGLELWQAELLKPNPQINDWQALIEVRNQLHMLEDLCEEQHDAVSEWLDAMHEHLPGELEASERDYLFARANDVIEHISRVVHHVRRLEQSAESSVQIYFGAQSHRTNNIMRTLTALTAVFLPLNLITGFFGMNFEFLPLIHNKSGLIWAVMFMVLIALVLILFFWRKRYLARTKL